MSTNEPRTLKTVERTLDIVLALRRNGGATVSELADELEMSNAGVHHHLATLRKRRFVDKKDSTYRLSYLFFNLGQFVQHQNVFYRVAKPQLRELSKRTGENCVLITEEFGEAVYLYRSMANAGVSEAFSERRLVERDALHVSAVGKALLSELPRERVDEIIDEHGLAQRTPNTITNRDELHEALELISQRDYAINDEESVRGIRSVGVPVLHSNSWALGAISIAGPTSRMSFERIHEDLSGMILEAANIIEVRLETQQESIIRSE